MLTLEIGTYNMTANIKNAKQYTRELEFLGAVSCHQVAQVARLLSVRFDAAENFFRHYGAPSAIGGT